MEEVITKQLDDKEYSTYEVLYIYYYKSKTSDLGNVTPMVSKWFNDALKANSNIVDDNVQYLKAEYHLVGGQDKDNPRVEVHIKGVTEEEHQVTVTTITDYFTKDEYVSPNGDTTEV